MDKNIRKNWFMECINHISEFVRDLVVGSRRRGCDTHNVSAQEFEIVELPFKKKWGDSCVGWSITERINSVKARMIAEKSLELHDIIKMGARDNDPGLMQQN